MSKKETYKSKIIDDILNEISPKEMKKVEKRMLLAAKIFDAIEAKGWRKKDFAAALGKGSSEISKWLSGTHNFTVDTLVDIEDVLDIELVATEREEKEQVIVFNLSVSQEQKTTDKSEMTGLEEENILNLLSGNTFSYVTESIGDC